MFSVKPDAQAAIASFFAVNPDIEKILRVYVTPGSCNGPMLSIMSDQVDPSDVAEEIGGVTFCMDKNLAGETGLVSVILKDGELVVRPERAFIDPSAFPAAAAVPGTVHLDALQSVRPMAVLPNAARAGAIRNRGQV